MNIAVMGATGRTGGLLLDELIRRGHGLSVLAREPAKLGLNAERVRVVTGDSRNAAALDELLRDAEAVVSVLGPTAKEPSPHSATAPILIAAMHRAGIRRFVGATGAGINIAGDQKSPLNKAISWLVERIGGAGVADRINELRVFQTSDLDWTMVRVPRLKDGPATGKIHADPHRSAKSVWFSRADLATFLADTVESNTWVRQAPLVGSGSTPAIELSNALSRIHRPRKIRPGRT